MSRARVMLRSSGCHLHARRPITEKDIEDRLLTAKVNCPPLDILIRTSGVRRLSDYLLWQASLLAAFSTKSPQALTLSGSAPKTHRYTSLIRSGQIWAFSIFSLLYWITSVKFGLSRIFHRICDNRTEVVSETRPWGVQNNSGV